LSRPRAIPAAPIFGRLFRVHFVQVFHRTASPLASALQYAMNVGGASGPARSSGAVSLPWRVLMNERTALLGFAPVGFFAVACIRASVPVSPASGTFWTNLLRFPGRIERLRRSRWQWFAHGVLHESCCGFSSSCPWFSSFMAATPIPALPRAADEATTRRPERRSNAAAA